MQAWAVSWRWRRTAPDMALIALAAAGDARSVASTAVCWRAPGRGHHRPRDRGLRPLRPGARRGNARGAGRRPAPRAFPRRAPGRDGRSRCRGPMVPSTCSASTAVDATDRCIARRPPARSAPSVRGRCAATMNRRDACTRRPLRESGSQPGSRNVLNFASPAQLRPTGAAPWRRSFDEPSGASFDEVNPGASVRSCRRHRSPEPVSLSTRSTSAAYRWR